VSFVINIYSRYRQRTDRNGWLADTSAFAWR